MSSPSFELRIQEQYTIVYQIIMQNGKIPKINKRTGWNRAIFGLVLKINRHAGWIALQRMIRCASRLLDRLEYLGF